ncbi:hypothetical protein KUTeg_016829 [Tegillarca granosa]|uniref:Uncharacterized protein n=1 Tax=Tegillarca granosa TaxID=220873 RepID=A0ABQ9EMY8_TEGGR|nr:hypothetical protein KUTeg_016829 [Tegillarca granosa]
MLLDAKIVQKNIVESKSVESSCSGYLHEHLFVLFNVYQCKLDFEYPKQNNNLLVSLFECMP